MRLEGIGRQGLLAASSSCPTHWFAMQNWSRCSHIQRSLKPNWERGRWPGAAAVPYSSC